MYRDYSPAFAFCLSLFLAAGCGGSSGNNVNVDMDSASGSTLDDSKAQLEEIVRGYIASERKNADESDADVHSFKPYYFKEFHDYPDGPDAFEIAFVEQDSKTAPLAADVTLRKLRFATPVQRDRLAVRGDANFMRETGTETISYELRNGRWHQMATLFVASEISTLSGGEWVPREETPRDEYVIPPEQPGFFRRTWEKMRIGGDSEPDAR